MNSSKKNPLSTSRKKASQKQALPILEKTVFDNRIVKFICRVFFRAIYRLLGWRLTPVAPEGCGITIAAPHTSNWDIFYAFGAALQHDVKIYFSIKENWCRVPVIGSIIRYMGAIPIDRSRDAYGQVDKIKAFVAANKDQRVFFLFTPEGTRSRADKWRTGFYHVAKDCDLPIFLAKVDYAKKECGVFHTFQLTENKERDIEAIQASYTSVLAKHPEHQFPVYTGPLPQLTPPEERVLIAIYELKGKATRAEIIARSKLDSLTTEMMDFLVKKGIVERNASNNESHDNHHAKSQYNLTILGSSTFFHLQMVTA